MHVLIIESPNLQSFSERHVDDDTVKKRGNKFIYSKDGSGLNDSFKIGLNKKSSKNLKYKKSETHVSLRRIQYLCVLMGQTEIFSILFCKEKVQREFHRRLISLSRGLKGLLVFFLFF